MRLRTHAASGGAGRVSDRRNQATSESAQSGHRWLVALDPAVIEVQARVSGLSVQLLRDQARAVEASRETAAWRAKKYDAGVFVVPYLVGPAKFSSALLMPIRAMFVPNWVASMSAK